MGNIVVNGLAVVLSAVGLFPPPFGLVPLSYWRSGTKIGGQRSNENRNCTGSNRVEITYQKQRLPGSVGESSIGKTAKRHCREITALPTELIENIFVNLDPRGLLACRGVSTRWHTIIETSSLLPCIFYRRYHPLSPIPRSPLPEGVASSYRETLGWLTRFSKEGNNAATRLDKLLTTVHHPDLRQILFFTTGRVLAQAKVFDDCQVCTIKRPERVRNACLSPDQQHLVVTSRNTAMVSRRRNGEWQEIITLPHDSAMTAGNFSPNGDYFIGRFRDKIQIWETFAEQWRIQTTFFHNYRVTPRFSPDGRYLVLRAGRAGAVQISRQVNGRWQQPTSLPESNDVVSSQFHPLDPILVALQHYSIVKIWRLVDQTWQLDTTIEQPFLVSWPLFSPDGHRLLVTFFNSPTVEIYQSINRDWHLETTLQLAKPINSLQCSPKGDHLVAEFQTRIGSIIELEYTVNIWRFTDNRWQELTLLHANEFRHACFSPEGGRLLTVSREQVITLWRDVAGQWQQETSLPSPGFSQPLAYHPYLPRWWWPEQEVLCDRVKVTSTCFSPHGYLAIAGDKTVTIWGMVKEKWQKKADLVHDVPIHRVTFSADGQYILIKHLNSESVPIWTLKCKDNGDVPVFGAWPRRGNNPFANWIRWLWGP